MRHITQSPIARNAPEVQTKEQQDSRDVPRVKILSYGKEMNMNVDYKAATENMKVLPTLRIDHWTLKILGISEDVFWYLDALKLKTFIEFENPSYTSLTRDFFSMVTLAYRKCKRSLAKDGVLSFKI